MSTNLCLICIILFSKYLWYIWIWIFIYFIHNISLNLEWQSQGVCGLVFLINIARFFFWRNYANLCSHKWSVKNVIFDLRAGSYQEFMSRWNKLKISYINLGIFWMVLSIRGDLCTWLIYISILSWGQLVSHKTFLNNWRHFWSYNQKVKVKVGKGQIYFREQGKPLTSTLLKYFLGLKYG